MIDVPTILFEDEHCLALWKRPGQFTQGDWAPPGDRTLEQEVRRYVAPDNPGSAYVGIVHRLDRPVSGVLLWAKTSRAARRLSGQFERRTVEKEYWAVVEDARDEAAGRDGPSQAVRGTWTDWLTRAGVEGVVRSLPQGSPGVREAITDYERGTPDAIPAGLAWLRLRPRTGRTHQLRVQAALRGMPIVGDSNYGSTRPFPDGIALHARVLRVSHPILHTPLILTAPLPQGWATLGVRIGGPAAGSPG
ncbi:tRNA pseudouridine synthase C [Aquisphaera giovannonii]|uniref:tRNA pseudouridine synthase C n=1 Tax=Aquisphaera giovannonii TaxID=406548 RepID=A0A5B9VXV3_9BACT|nr:RluA family pseudouridine synthase [Aquisphaera giovannonii]QEH33122.1 tRNA pseudouridine synthase C [Aquisphaera giovannonii]